MENTDKSMIDFGSIIKASSEKIFSVENITAKIEASFDAALNTAIEDQLSRYGKTKKAIQEAIEESLCVNLDLGLPSYNSVIAKLVKEKIEASLFNIGKEQIGAEIDKLLEMPPKKIELSEIIEKFSEFAAEANEDNSEGEFTCILDEGSRDGYYRMYLDTTKDVEKYRCDFTFAVTPKGEIYSLKTKQYHGDIDTDRSKFHSMQLGSLEKLLFNLYTCKSKIIDDCDGCFDNSYYRD